MMGQHARSEALFYYFRFEDQIPETHLLRLIDKHGILRQLRAVRRRQSFDFGVGGRQDSEREPNGTSLFSAFWLRPHASISLASNDFPHKRKSPSEVQPIRILRRIHLG